jgi:hypothetical protein
LGAFAITWLVAFVGRFLVAPSEICKEAQDRAVSAEARTADLLAEFSHVLQLENVSAEDRRQTNPATGAMERRVLQFFAILYNSHDRPVRYTVTNLTVDGAVQQNPGTRTGVIPARTRATYYAQQVEATTDMTQLVSARIAIDIDYGHPNRPASREIHKDMIVEVFPNGHTSMRYLADTDEPKAIEV